MGRCEGFARSNPIWPSFVDGIATGCGYALVLLTVAFIRELFGFGTLFGIKVMPPGWTNWTIMVMAPAAFFVLGIIIWVAYTVAPKKEQT
jgi:Na+-transporting NADH:ubiquinone oxidoreductase subunit D